MDSDNVFLLLLLNLKIILIWVQTFSFLYDHGFQNEILISLCLLDHFVLFFFVFIYS